MVVPLSFVNQKKTEKKFKHTPNQHSSKMLLLSEIVEIKIIGVPTSIMNFLSKSEEKKRDREG
jgi:hypothetical protein